MIVTDGQAEKSTQRHSLLSGCLIALPVLGTLLVLVVIVIFESERRSKAELEQTREEYRLLILSKVRAGNGYVVFMDAELVEMLADDPKCAETVEDIFFSIVDLRDPRCQRIREFKNVHSVGFYDCEHADDVMTVVKEMPLLESLYFEGTTVSDDSLRSLVDCPHLKSIKFEQRVSLATTGELKQLLSKVTIEIPELDSEEPTP